MGRKVSAPTFQLVKFGLLIWLILLAALTVSFGGDRGGFVVWGIAILGAIGAAVLEVRFLRRVRERISDKALFFLYLALFSLDFSLLLFLLSRVVFLALVLLAGAVLFTVFFSAPVSAVKTTYRDSSGIAQEATKMYFGDAASAKRKAQSEINAEHGHITDQESEEL